MKKFMKFIMIAVMFVVAMSACKKEHVTGVTLNQLNLTLSVGESATLKAMVHPENAANQAVRWESSNMDVATVVNGIVTAKAVGTTTITVITEDGNFTATCTVTVAPEWVEINGVKWAKRNVNTPGSFTIKPEDAGMFYQWNSPIGWSSTDPLISTNGDTAWYFTIDTHSENTIWEKANNPCPAGWRVPTPSEQISLIEAGSRWTTLNGVDGRIFGSGDNTIFLPAVGLRDSYRGYLCDIGEKGYYWSNSSSIDWIQFLGFDSDDDRFTCGMGSGHTLRCHGFSVRCVAE